LLWKNNLAIFSLSDWARYYSGAVGQKSVHAFQCNCMLFALFFVDDCPLLVPFFHLLETIPVLV